MEEKTIPGTHTSIYLVDKMAEQVDYSFAGYVIGTQPSSSRRTVDHAWPGKQMRAILQALGSGWQNMPDCSKPTVYSLPPWSCIASSLQTLMVAWAFGQQQWESGERKSLPYSRLLQPLCPRAHKQVNFSPYFCPLSPAQSDSPWRPWN